MRRIGFAVESSRAGALAVLHRPGALRHPDYLVLCISSSPEVLL